MKHDKVTEFTIFIISILILVLINIILTGCGQLTEEDFPSIIEEKEELSPELSPKPSLTKKKIVIIKCGGCKIKPPLPPDIPQPPPDIDEPKIISEASYIIEDPTNWIFAKPLPSMYGIKEGNVTCENDNSDNFFDWLFSFEAEEGFIFAQDFKVIINGVEYMTSSQDNKVSLLLKDIEKSTILGEDGF
jgi:hypothetical protein